VPKVTAFVAKWLIRHCLSYTMGKNTLNEVCQYIKLVTENMKAKSVRGQRAIVDRVRFVGCAANIKSG